MELLYDGKISSLGAVSKATVLSLCEFYEVSGEVSPNAGILPSPDLVSMSTKQQSNGAPFMANWKLVTFKTSL